MSNLDEVLARRAANMTAPAKSAAAAVGFKAAPRARSETLDPQRLGSIAGVELDNVPPLAVCEPGLIPSEYNCVIAPAVMPEQSTGGVMFVDETIERQSGAMQVGRLIAVSPIAFNYDVWPDGTHPPQIGQIVWFARYAGGEFLGKDGRTYRIVKDKDVNGIVPE